MPPCLKRIDADCFAAHPAWAKKAFAYRLVHLLTPKPLTKRLPKTLRLALIAPGIEIAPGVEIPPGVVVSPGAEVPATWNPGDPLPSGAIDAPALPPDAQDSGPIAPLYTAPGEPGPTKTIPQQTPVEPWRTIFTIEWWTCGANCSWDGVTWHFNLVFVFSNGILFRRTNSGWYQDFRPSAIRLTYTGGPITRFLVRDTDSMDICVPSDTTLASLEIRPLVFAGGKDIDSLFLKSSVGPVDVSNIEFYTG